MSLLPAPLVADLHKLIGIIEPVDITTPAARERLAGHLQARAKRLLLASDHPRLQLLMIAAQCLAAVAATDAATLPVPRAPIAMPGA